MVAAAKTKELPRRNWQKIEKKNKNASKKHVHNPTKEKKNRVGLVNEYGGVSTKSGTVI